jgi:Terminase small subunit
MAGDASRVNGRKGGRPRKDGTPASSGGKRLEEIGVAKSLTAKQGLFVVAFCGPARFNATEAYVQAFETKDRQQAGTRAARLLKLPHVRSAVLDNLAAAAEASGIMTGDEAMEGISRVARFDIGDAYDVQGRLLPVHRMPFRARDAVTSIKVATKRDPAGTEPTDVLYVTELKFSDKLRARELIAKGAGRLKEKIELEASKGLVELLAEIEGVIRV